MTQPALHQCWQVMEDRVPAPTIALAMEISVAKTAGITTHMATANTRVATPQVPVPRLVVPSAASFGAASGSGASDGGAASDREP